MRVRFREVVQVGSCTFRPGEETDLDNDTAKALIGLRVAIAMNTPVPEAKPVPPPSRVVAESDTLPAPEPKKKGGLFGRKKSG